MIKLLDLNVNVLQKYNYIPIIVTIALLLLIVWISPVFKYVPNWISASISMLKLIFKRRKAQKITGDNTIDKIIAATGYLYDTTQDIFYSDINAWQYEMGYCRLYDEAAPPLGMIIDCEPIYFEYEGKRWLVEFWKGQYDMTTGCEIGIYNTTEPDVNIPGIFNGTFYDCAKIADQLHIYFVLKKNGEKLFERKGRHWWLTGFVLGEFSQPSNLSMYAEITFKNYVMRDAFMKGMLGAGYKLNDITIIKNKVCFEFDKTCTKQPSTRTVETDKMIQKNNKVLCDKYQEITKPYDTMPDKVKAIQNQAPDLYKHILNIGKTEQVFWNHEIIMNYLRSTLKNNLLKEISEIFESCDQIFINNSSKFIIMSDCHRGDGSASDDFSKNEDLFYTALKTYYKNNFTYIEIGDGDELWENRKIESIINAHSGVYHLLSKYHRKERLYFIYGNHDIVKKNLKSTLNHLNKYNKNYDYPIWFNNIKFHEGLVLNDRATNNKILLVHGHQVDYFNNKLWWLARFLVRYLWKPLELIGIQDTTRTCKVYEKKELVDRRLTKWVIKEKQMLIAGHTHRPMFPEIGLPAYFNDGSCVDPSGITGIEIENGYIRLVKWSYETLKSNGNDDYLYE